MAAHKEEYFIGDVEETLALTATPDVDANPQVRRRQPSARMVTLARTVGMFVAAVVLLSACSYGMRVARALRGSTATGGSDGIEMSGAASSELVLLAAADLGTCSSPQEGKSSSGLTFKTAFAASASECCDRCLEEASCKSYTFQKMMGTCWLKSNEGWMTPDFSSASGTVSREVAKPAASTVASTVAKTTMASTTPAPATSASTSVTAPPSTGPPASAASTTQATAVVTTPPPAIIVTTPQPATTPATPPPAIVVTAPPPPAIIVTTQPPATTSATAAPASHQASSKSKEAAWPERCSKPITGMHNSGKALMVGQATNLRECCVECIDVESCKGFTWVHATGECILKDVVGKPEHDTYYNTACGTVS